MAFFWVAVRTPLKSQALQPLVGITVISLMVLSAPQTAVATVGDYVTMRPTYVTSTERPRLLVLSFRLSFVFIKEVVGDFFEFVNLGKANADIVIQH